MTKEKRKLENWWITGSPRCGFKTPERREIHLVGTVDKWKDKTDHEIRTSYVVAANGREITTYSGSVYVLGLVDPEYKGWLDENRADWDPENPIKMID